VCRGRKNINGTLIAVNYGEVVSMQVDPIEKKPLYHFHPGDPILSVGPNGCNLSCSNCQNWTISQIEQPTSHVSPEDLTDIARSRGSAGIAYTYSEPMIWFEYILDAGSIAHANSLYNVCVTNGYINPEPLNRLMPVLDAVNVDLKSIRPEFYRRVCKGRLETVQGTIEACFEANVHVEVTHLVIPGMNDSEEEFEELSTWLAGVSKSIPLHISRYFPNYEMEVDATPIATLERAYYVAREHLEYVFVGNATVDGASDTICPHCGNRLIERSGYRTNVVGMTGSICSECNSELNIVV